MELLSERKTTHGDFDLNAIISQRIKSVYSKCHPQWDELSATHKEALDMIALKISRILSGKAMFKDHWDDIAGYAKLASDHCSE